jgi:hypothetical protein
MKLQFAQPKHSEMQAAVAVHALSTCSRAVASSWVESAKLPFSAVVHEA